MKKVWEVFKKVFVGIFLICYFSLILVLSTLLLTRNDYGITEIKDKALINITEKNANGKYKVGDLVILNKKQIKDLKIGDEIFVYQPNKKTKTVDIVISEISKINTELKSPYVTIKYNETSWAEDYIAGVPSNIYHKVGGVLDFFEGKWIFLLTLIIPCFFILLYEIYLLIVTIKYDDYDYVEETKNNNQVPVQQPVTIQEPIGVQTQVHPQMPSPVSLQEPSIAQGSVINNNGNGIIYISDDTKEDTNNKLNNLSNELLELKKKIDSGNSGPEDNNKIDSLMRELELLKQNIK